MPASNRLQVLLQGAYIASEFSERHPDYRALLVAVDGIIPAPCDDLSDTLLRDAEVIAQNELARHQVTEIPHVLAWRNAYKTFGAKPQRTRNSLEALLRRVEKGLPRVNWRTDVYNAISVKHLVPIEGEDLDRYQGSPRLILATGNEDFETVVDGANVIEHPRPRRDCMA